MKKVYFYHSKVDLRNYMFTNFKNVLAMKYLIHSRTWEHKDFLIIEDQNFHVVKRIFFGLKLDEECVNCVYAHFSILFRKLNI